MNLLTDPNYQSRKIAEAISKFSSLQDLKIECSNNRPQDDSVKQWLGDLGNIEAWQRYIRTLRKVVVYGVIIE